MLNARDDFPIGRFFASDENTGLAAMLLVHGGAQATKRTDPFEGKVMDHPKTELKWIDADDLDESGRKLSGLPVRGSDGTTLGEVEGFVIDVREGQPRHVGVAEA